MANKAGKKGGDKRVTVGFDLGGTKMYAVVFDRSMRELGKARKPTEGHRGAEAGVGRMVEVIEEALASAGVEEKRLGAIGIGCPGIVDMERGVLRSAPNLGWPDVPLKKLLEARFGCRVAIVNDVDGGTYGEYVAGAGKGARSLLGVFPGTGIGGGFVYDHRLLRGARYSAMEIGRLPWPVPGLTSRPGEWPIFETGCSRLAISSALAAEAFRGNAPTIMEKSGTDLSKIKSKAIAAAYRAGDDGVVNVLTNAVENLAAGMAAVVNLLAPDRVVMGGGLVEAMPEVIVGGVAERLGRYAAEELLEDLEIKEAELGDEATVTGAAAFARAD